MPKTHFYDFSIAKIRTLSNGVILYIVGSEVLCWTIVMRRPWSKNELFDTKTHFYDFYIVKIRTFSNRVKLYIVGSEILCWAIIMKIPWSKNELFDTKTHFYDFSIVKIRTSLTLFVPPPLRIFEKCEKLGRDKGPVFCHF